MLLSLPIACDQWYFLRFGGYCRWLACCLAWIDEMHNPAQLGLAYPRSTAGSGHREEMGLWARHVK